MLIHLGAQGSPSQNREWVQIFFFTILKIFSFDPKWIFWNSNSFQIQTIFLAAWLFLQLFWSGANTRSQTKQMNQRFYWVKITPSQGGKYIKQSTSERKGYDRPNIYWIKTRKKVFSNNAYITIMNVFPSVINKYSNVDRCLTIKLKLEKKSEQQCWI